MLYLSLSVLILRQNFLIMSFETLLFLKLSLR